MSLHVPAKGTLTAPPTPILGDVAAATLVPMSVVIILLVQAVAPDSLGSPVSRELWDLFQVRVNIPRFEGGDAETLVS
jgi:hypothetical protein